MALAVASVHLRDRSVMPRAIRIVERHPLVPWTAAAACFAALVWILPDINRDPGGAVGTVLESLAYAGVGLFLLLPAVFGEHAGGLPRRLLAWGPIAWLGLISYGIYLYHYPLVFFFALHFSRTEVLALGLVSTILVAAASWYFLERPILAANRRREREAERQPSTVQAPVAAETV
jgi:peptidoglycan/LPS O-acetylase OafA/YrhL